MRQLAEFLVVITIRAIRLCSLNVCAVRHYPDRDFFGSNWSHHLCNRLQRTSAYTLVIFAQFHKMRKFQALILLLWPVHDLEIMRKIGLLYFFCLCFAN